MTNGPVMITRTEPTPTEIADAITAILTTIATQPHTTTCPHDGCLLIAQGPCPACQLRTGPRLCDCGRRLNYQDAETCWVCLRQARIANRLVCGCGVVIRTDGDLCSRCRRAERGRVCGCGASILTVHEQCSRCRRRSVPAGGWSGRWVQRGGIMRPVFDEVA